MKSAKDNDRLETVRYSSLSGPEYTDNEIVPCHNGRRTFIVTGNIRTEIEEVGRL